MKAESFKKSPKPAFAIRGALSDVVAAQKFCAQMLAQAPADS
jgi:hypothetical protein